MPAKNKTRNLKVVDEAKSETEVVERAKRRRFTKAYKARILRETDAASTGTIGGILRREGLYSSHLTKWRTELGLEEKKRGPKANPLTRENHKLRQENRRLERKLAQANEIIDLQKKISKILGITLQENGETE
jgi:transposase-like protein